MIVKDAAKGAFSAFPAGNLVLLRGQLFSPFLVRFNDFRRQDRLAKIAMGIQQAYADLLHIWPELCLGVGCGLSATTGDQKTGDGSQDGSRYLPHRHQYSSGLESRQSVRNVPNA